MKTYYSLSTMPVAKRRIIPAAFNAAWDRLRQGISFSHISADDLAFVYENTLVTPEARQLFGTHSTPRQVAEYVVARLELHRYPPESLKVYEPFAGAGVFLVSALRHLRDLLPVDWTDQKRHGFLVEHLAGDEIDPFACEVAMLSLILADYPNHNGWNIREADLFEGDTLKARMRARNVILCNPPFEAFTPEERGRYKIATQTYSKPMAALNAALDAHPLALGFVLPRPFILERQFADQRRRVEGLYGDVELVELPDRIFGASTIESALLIAREPRPPAPNLIRRRSTEIADRDRVAFLKTGDTTVQRTQVRPLSHHPHPPFWIPSLPTVCPSSQNFPRMEERVTVHRGIEWKSAQDEAWSNQRRAGYRRGIHSARNPRQFVLPRPVCLACSPDRLLYQAIDLPWSEPKLVANAARLSRGPWRVAARLDKTGLISSPPYFGIWPRTTLVESDFLALAAVLNGPLANAFLAVHSPANRIRASAVEKIPIPPSLPRRVADLVSEYTSLLANNEVMRDDTEKLSALLAQIDAAVLEAYDLPPRLERELLNYFQDSERPVAHTWVHWDIPHPAPGLRLAERASARFRPTANRASTTFHPLPNREAELLREFGE